ncbi:MAG: 2-oxoacid:acceptor oxidoreductase family protein [Nitrososphaeria archaeon]
MIYEIRLHGRGGQGAVLAGRLLGEALMNAGHYAQSYPEFGAERSGAPVTAFLRTSDLPIEVRSPISRPNIVLVIDPYLSVDRQVIDGLRDGGLVVANAALAPDKLRGVLGVPAGCRVATVNATKIALEVLGRNNPNTAVLGALAEVSKIVSLEFLMDAAKRAFPGRVGELNAQAIRRGAEEAVVA